MKFIVIIAFVAIIGSLFIALIAMMRANSSRPEEKGSRRMAKALTARIGLSVTLFLFVLLAYQMGWIQPTGIAPGQ